MHMSRYCSRFCLQIEPNVFETVSQEQSSDQSASDQRALRGAAECVEALQTQQDELKQKGRKGSPVNGITITSVLQPKSATVQVS